MKKFKFGDEVKIIIPQNERDGKDKDLLMFNDHIGTFICDIDTRYETSLVKINNGYEPRDYVPIPKEYIKSPDEKENEDYYIDHNEKSKEKNFVTILKDSLSILDGVVFATDKDNTLCYFKDGEFFIIGNLDPEMKVDRNLRNEIFHGLATGSIKPQTPHNAYPQFGSEYFYWRTSYFCPETFSIESNRWRGLIEDFYNFYFGNCFATKEECEKNSKVIELIKNKAFLKQYEKD